VVGSGNAEAMGRIFFEDTNAIFSSESSYENKLKHIPDLVISGKRNQNRLIKVI